MHGTGSGHVQLRSTLHASRFASRFMLDAPHFTWRDDLFTSSASTDHARVRPCNSESTQRPTASLGEYLMMLIIVNNELILYGLGSILRSTMPKEHRPYVIIPIATDGGPLGLTSITVPPLLP